MDNNILDNEEEINVGFIERNRITPVLMIVMIIMAYAIINLLLARGFLAVAMPFYLILMVAALVVLAIERLILSAFNGSFISFVGIEVSVLAVLLLFLLT